MEKAQRELGYAPGAVEPVLRENAARRLLDAGSHISLNGAQHRDAMKPGF